MMAVNVWGQADDKQAFKQLKKLQGTWQMLLNEEKIYEECTLESKNTLRLKKYKIQSSDTILLNKATIYYSKFIRFNHPSSVHYNIKALDSDVIYPFRLEKAQNNTFTFSNFNNDFPNEIIFQWSEKVLIVKQISKDKQKNETFSYKRIK
jgi:hypothetical protein